MNAYEEDGGAWTLAVTVVHNYWKCFGMTSYSLLEAAILCSEIKISITMIYLCQPLVLKMYIKL